MTITALKSFRFLLLLCSTLFIANASAAQVTIWVQNSTPDMINSAEPMLVGNTKISFPTGQKLMAASPGGFGTPSSYAILSQVEGAPTGEITLKTNEGAQICKIYVLYDSANKKYTTITEEPTPGYSCSAGDVDSSGNVQVKIAKMS